MRRSISRMLLLATSIIIPVAACDGPTVAAPAAPTARDLPAAQSELLSSPIRVNVLQRTTPLASPLTASGTFGLFGGSLRIRGAGFTLVIPPLALTRRTTITVTALAGRNVAYDMQPHGVHFLVPLVATQSLSGTNATGLLSAYFAGYYQSATDLLGDGTASITEILALQVNLLAQTAVFTIPHFSGYLIATGRAQ